MDTPSGGHIALAITFWLSVAGILYTYFGYPIIIALLARLFPKNEQASVFAPSVTLLIAAYNEEMVIRNKIINCLSLNYPKDRFQILVVTDGSSDGTPKIVGEFESPNVKLLHQSERKGKMAAITRAVAMIKSEVIVFSDANNIYQPDTLAKLVAPFSNPTVGAVTGAKVIEKGDGNLGDSEGLYWKYESFIKWCESQLGSCTSAAGEVLAIRKELYVTPPPKIINDDFFIAMQVIKQGYRLLYEPAAKSIERVSPSAKDEIIRRTRINAGRFQAITLGRQVLPIGHPVLIWQIFSHKFLRPIVPLFMLWIAIASVISVIFPPNAQHILLMGAPFNYLILFTQILFYSLAWLGGLQLSQNKKMGVPGKLLYITTFLVNSNFAALKGFVQFIRGGQFHLWDRIERR